MMNISGPSEIPRVMPAVEAGTDHVRPRDEAAGSVGKTGTLFIRRLTSYGGAVVVGTLFAIVLSRLTGQTADAPIVGVIFVSFLSMCAATLALGLAANAIVLIAPFTLGGICVGVVANAMYDSLVTRVAHDLLPIEIAVVAVVAAPGVTAGMGLAWLLRRRHLR